MTHSGTKYYSKQWEISNVGSVMDVIAVVEDSQLHEAHYLVDVTTHVDEIMRLMKLGIFVNMNAYFTIFHSRGPFPVFESTQLDLTDGICREMRSTSHTRSGRQISHARTGNVTFAQALRPETTTNDLLRTALVTVRAAVTINMGDELLADYGRSHPSYKYVRPA